MTIRAVDCHMHIFGDQRDYPFAEPRSYTVPPAGIDAYWKAVAETDIDRVVVVQPSAYGTDNRCTLDALDAVGDAARGVAVIDADRVSDTDLATLHARRVRGVRVNLRSVRAAAAPVDAVLPKLDRLLSGSAWHIQVFCDASVLADLAAIQPTLSVPLVLDHFGAIDPLNPDRHLADMRRLLDGGAWVKLSGSYRISTGPDGAGVADLARAIHAMAPDRMVWASDWPHTPKHSGATASVDTMLSYQPLDTAGLYHAVADWFPEAETRRQILQDNPARLYGWDD
ncbi:amidohydrolase family protein [Thalassobaculum sp. OXR-137]|uniref:amidohydrolase family protein n=1 Tax=Thalassobaculum sp. OXR-137 TaxID=3100173 RepID=UPI002AC95FAE|nr:amidohydrolase family protein [Thalassobaculum sp. OXR-137]WPZ33859.1 amidohydrolase family protein [Thalassobaculum sp. OXR-137]